MCVRDNDCNDNFKIFSYLGDENMNLEKLKNEWQELGYNLELKDLDTLKPVAHVKANDVLITITNNNTKVLSLNLITWTNTLNRLITSTQEFLGREKINVIRTKIEENFETKDCHWFNQSNFVLTVENCEVSFYPNKFRLIDTQITPETLKTLNKIAKVLDWEADD